MTTLAELNESIARKRGWKPVQAGVWRAPEQDWHGAIRGYVVPDFTAGEWPLVLLGELLRKDWYIVWEGPMADAFIAPAGIGQTARYMSPLKPNH